MNIFELAGTIAIHNTQANKALFETGKKAKSLSGTMDSAFGKIESMAKKVGAAVAAAFAVDKIKDFGKDCAETYASIAAEQASFEQIMGDYAYMAQEKMDKVASETGMVSSRLTPYMTSMTAKFKGLGYGVDEATNLAQEGLTIAADASAFWDKSLDESMSHLNSFVNGSYEGGEAIGLFANDTQMAAYAVKKGIVSETKAWSALDEATKQATRLQYAKDMMAQSGATGQAAKESGEYANVLANLNEHMRQLKGVIGKPILEKLILPAMRTLNKIMPGLTKKTEAFMQGFSDGLDKIAGYFKDVFTEDGLNLSALPDAFGRMFSDIIKKIPAKFSSMKAALSSAWKSKLWPLVQQLFKAAFQIELPEWDDVKKELSASWEESKGKINDILKIAFNIDLTDWETTKASALENIQSFVNDVTGLLSSIYTWATGEGKSVVEFFLILGAAILIWKSPMVVLSGVIAGLILNWDNLKTAAGKCYEKISDFFGIDIKSSLGDAISDIATGFEGLKKDSIDAILGFFKWCQENGEVVAGVLGAIATKIVLAAIAAHPFASAITAVLAGLSMLEAKSMKALNGEVFDKYSDEDLAKLQKYVDALKAAKTAEKEMIDSGYDTDATLKFYDADDALKQAEIQIKDIKGLKDAYYSYIQANGIGKDDDIYLDVPLRVDEDSESTIQTEVDGMSLEGLVKLAGDTSALQAAVDSLDMSVTVPVYGTTGTQAADGSHANGLNFVPRDGYLARLHYGETVLNRANADAWRNGTMGSAEVGRLETAINALSGLMQQMVANTRGGQQIVLDSGVLVGQLAPRMDEQLGTISGRKGRRN